MADVCVFPSISEPFGIVALEAMASGKPVIISKTSGVAEVLRNCFKVDFWDINLLASRILELLNYPPLSEEMKENGSREVERLSWENTCLELARIYRKLVR